MRFLSIVFNNYFVLPLFLCFKVLLAVLVTTYLPSYKVKGMYYFGILGCTE